MWPWEHLAFGYLLYSAFSRAVRRERPDGLAAVAVAVGTQVPDLIDKPIAWVLDVATVGYAVGHSALVVVPALAAAVVLAGRRGRTARTVAVGYAVGHLSHLLGDLVYPLVLGSGLQLRRLLWPVATYPGHESRVGAVERVLGYLLEYVHQMLTLDLGALFLVQVVLVVGVFAVWLADGAPGPGALWRLATGGDGRR